MVSPSARKQMAAVYKHDVELPEDKKDNIRIVPMLLKESQLNCPRMLKLMAVDSTTGGTLYVEGIRKILRDMMITDDAGHGFSYRVFKDRLERQGFDNLQKGALYQRLDILESCFTRENDPSTEFGNFQKVATNKVDKKLKQPYHDQKAARMRAILNFNSNWNSEPGSLTIVDLSDPFVSPEHACMMYNIVLDIFMEATGSMSKIIALDEAHKFLAGSDAAQSFTDDLLDIIRQQRHLAARVIIATQEPTLSPALLALCNITFVHRFNSPEWYRMLKQHIAAIYSFTERNSEHGKRLFDDILGLGTGQAFIFAPSAMLDRNEESKTDSLKTLKMDKLEAGYAKVQIRKRITADGGRSKVAVKYE